MTEAPPQIGTVEQSGTTFGDNPELRRASGGYPEKRFQTVPPFHKPSEDIIERCRSLGIRLWSEDGRLRYDAPAGMMAPDLVATLRENRQAILETLDSPPSGEATPDPPMAIRRAAVITDPDLAAAIDAAWSPHAAAPRRWRCGWPCCYDKRHWWRSIHGAIFCAHCHPPSSPDLIAARGDESDAPLV